MAVLNGSDIHVMLANPSCAMVGPDTLTHPVEVNAKQEFPDSA